MPLQQPKPPPVPGAPPKPTGPQIRAGIIPYGTAYGNPNFALPSPFVYTPAYQIPYYQQTRGSYLDLINQLQGQSRGEGPTVAENLFQKTQDESVRQAMAQAASQAGFQPSGSTQRQVSNQIAQSGQEASMNAALLRAQEIMSSRQLLAQVLQQLSGFDVNQSQSNMALQELISGRVQATEMKKSQEQQGLLGGLFGLFSDEELKKHIRDEAEDYKEFLDLIGGIYG